MAYDLMKRTRDGFPLCRKSITDDLDYLDKIAANLGVKSESEEAISAMANQTGVKMHFTTDINGNVSAHRTDPEWAISEVATLVGR